jgi:DNA-binding response OmpR family regulator
MSELENHYRIFVLDDEPVIASTLGEILRRQGYAVTCFTEPLKALEAIHTKAPDLLIADVVMPEMSGIDLAIVMQETCPSCIVLLFSGQILTFQLLESARNRGYDFEVLSKPVPPTELLARIRSELWPDSHTEGLTGAVAS